MTEENKQACNWGMLCHLTALSGFIGVPFGNILGPLIIWLIKKNEIPFVDDQGKESLNFQISMFIYTILPLLLTIFLCIFFPILLILLVANIVLVIIASVKASNGEAYRYPFTIRFIK
ncbi:MAG: DUF4870 domain-containing protein [Candidatus Aureabacteria bacterium]|nr:DUF4870 domain-containing protein [Candidatus Auribacterota bacterium]